MHSCFESVRIRTSAQFFDNVAIPGSIRFDSRDVWRENEFVRREWERRNEDGKGETRMGKESERVKTILTGAIVHWSGVCVEGGYPLSDCSRVSSW